MVQGAAVQDACSELVEDTAMVFSGPGIRQAITNDLDLRNAKFIQYHATIGGTGTTPECSPPASWEQDVVLQYTTDGGITWHSLHTLDHTAYTSPRRDYIPLPLSARTPSTKIRWWQPLPSNPSAPRSQWAIDNVYIGGTEINPSEFQASFNETGFVSDAPWEFSPHGHIVDEVCTRTGSVLSWQEGSGTRSFVTNQLIIQRGYMLQFKIEVGCNQRFNACDPFPPVRLEFNTNPSSDRWELLLPLCVPDINGQDCQPNSFHGASIYSNDAHPTWTRVTIQLPEKVYSSTSRLRWIQEASDRLAPAWALDDIYVGEKCDNMCSGRGDCTYGECICDDGYIGKTCQPQRKLLITRMYDSFEGGIYSSHWSSVTGGGIGFGCGALLPYAHGKTLYFSDCGQRHAVTVEMDLSTASKIMFVLQIGCREQTDECNVMMGKGANYRGILLQYTTDKGAQWRTLARHDPEDFLNPKRVAYDIPAEARVPGVQFRWWQPVHDGAGYDQWAIDSVEIIPGQSRVIQGRWHR
ncbi:hypothetical protein ScPMuIL_009765 [Solemya velum]